MPAATAIADARVAERVASRLLSSALQNYFHGGAPADRYFVQLNDIIVVVLNLSAPDLPKRQLLNMAIDNPAWIAGTSKTTYRDNNLRVGPDGVFVKDKKVAELNQVVEWIPRTKVTAIDK